MTRNWIPGAILVFTLIASIVGILGADRINKWEREAGYPYGKLCDVFHSCAR